MKIICEFVVEPCIQRWGKLVRICGLISTASTKEEKVWSLNFIIKTHSLARVDNHKYLFIHSLQIHFIKNFCQVS